MRTKQNPVWLLALFFTTLTLAACVRPYPKEESATESVPELVVTQPSLQPEQPQPTPIDEVVPVATVGELQPTVEPLPTEEPAGETIHTVEPGDTLFKIASQYGVTIDVITSVNDIPNINQLEVGQQILIPAPGTVVLTSTPEGSTAETPVPPAEAPTQLPSAAGGTHVVQAGENLYRIGLQYGCSVEQMAIHNGIVDAATISVGLVLQIPNCN